MHDHLTAEALADRVLANPPAIRLNGPWAGLYAIADVDDVIAPLAQPDEHAQPSRPAGLIFARHATRS